MKRFTNFVAVLIFVFSLATTAIAQGGPQVMDISCTHRKPAGQTAMKRPRGDSNRWTFRINPAPGVHWVEGPTWVRDAGGADPEWGQWSGGGSKLWSGWDAPNKVGHFNIKVTGKITCGEGGGGEAIDIEASWDGDVAEYEYSKGDPSHFMGLFYDGSFAPMQPTPPLEDPHKSPTDALVSKGDRISLNKSWNDTDLRRRSENDAWDEIPGVGPYEITFTLSGNGVSFDQDNPQLALPPFTVDQGKVIDPGNIYVYVSNLWDEQPFTITASIDDQGVVPAGSSGSVKDDPLPDDVKEFKARGQYKPKQLITLENAPGAASEGQTITPPSPIPQFWYQARPASPRESDDPPSTQEPAYYTDQTIDEVFTSMEPTFTLNDLTDEWMEKHPNMTAEDAFKDIFGTSLINTSFRIHDYSQDFKDIIIDPHSLAPTSSQLAWFTSTARSSNVIGWTSVQTYIAAGRELATFQLNLSYNDATHVQTLYKARISN